MIIFDEGFTFPDTFPLLQSLTFLSLNVTSSSHAESFHQPLIDLIVQSGISDLHLSVTLEGNDIDLKPFDLLSTKVGAFDLNLNQHNLSPIHFPLMVLVSSLLQNLTFTDISAAQLPIALAASSPLLKSLTVKVFSDTDARREIFACLIPFAERSVGGLKHLDVVLLGRRDPDQGHQLDGLLALKQAVERAGAVLSFDC